MLTKEQQSAVIAIRDELWALEKKFEDDEYARFTVMMPSRRLREKKPQDHQIPEMVVVCVKTAFLNRLLSKVNFLLWKGIHGFSFVSENAPFRVLYGLQKRDLAEWAAGHGDWHHKQWWEMPPFVADIWDGILREHPALEGVLDAVKAVGSDE